MFTLLLIIVSSFFAASMDSVRVNYRKSLYSKLFPKSRSFFDESISWKNKYKKGDRNRGSRFWLSTTLLSFLTDFYSLSRFILTISMITLVVFYTPIFGTLDIIFLYLAFSISYEGFKKFLIS